MQRRWFHNWKMYNPYENIIFNYLLGSYYSEVREGSTYIHKNLYSCTQRWQADGQSEQKFQANYQNLSIQSDGRTILVVHGLTIWWLSVMKMTTDECWRLATKLSPANSYALGCTLLSNNSIDYVDFWWNVKKYLILLCCFACLKHVENVNSFL